MHSHTSHQIISYHIGNSSVRNLHCLKTMSESSILSFINLRKRLNHTGKVLRPTQARLPSRATLDTLNHISRNSIPLIGFAHPIRGLVPSFIREIWLMDEEKPRMPDWLTELPFSTLENEHKFRGHATNSLKCAPIPPLSPVQGNGETLELDVHAPGPSRLPALESTPKRRGSCFPPTPVILPSDSVEEPVELSLGSSNTSVEDEAEVQLAVNGPPQKIRGHDTSDR